MKALIVGGSGYTGGELIRILAKHPEVEDWKATSRKYEGQKIEAAHPSLREVTDKKFEKYGGASDADVVFLALPHGQSMEYAPKLLDAGVKVIDLSADYRIDDVDTYEQYYVKHKNPQLLGDAVYGLPELYRNEIKKAKLIANPGCYTTAAILSLAPLERYSHSIDLKVLVDAKSGVSGAGVKPTDFLHFCEVEGNVKPYKVCGHRHQPEMEHILRKYIPGLSVSFTPTLVPVVRGISSNAHVFADLDAVDVQEHYTKYYEGEPFVRVVEDAYTKNVNYSNYCDIATYYDKEKKRAVIVSAIDNLVKGASGQAVQNMNLAMGYDEALGLESLPYHP